MFAARRAGAAGRDLRLGDGDDRRSARRRRLHDDPLDRGRRHARQVQRCRTSPSAPASRRAQELIARYEERSGRSVQALDWYVTLALWKAVVFMEGNYKRALSGSTDDPYLKSFGEGVVEIADARADGHAAMASENGHLPWSAHRLRRRADDRPVRVVPRLLRASRVSRRTRSAGSSARTATCRELLHRPRDRRGARGGLRARFAPHARRRRRRPDRPAVRRLEPDEPMLAAVRRARAGGVRTGLVSNSWGTRRYPRELLAELFDGVVISGEVGIRKPAPEIYALGAEQHRPGSRGVRVRRRPAVNLDPRRRARHGDRASPRGRRDARRARAPARA